MRKLTIILILLTGMGIHFRSNATIITFDDKSSFLSSTGAINATGALPDLGLIAGGAGASQSVGSVTFSITPPSSQLYMGTSGTVGVTNNDWTTRLAGADIAISDIENLNVDLSGSIFSFGFDFVEPENDPNVNAFFIDSTFIVTLLDGLSFVDSFTFNAVNDTAAFIGVWSDTIFDRVEIRETIGGIDNEFFGQFYTGTAALEVPEPATFALMGLGLFGLGFSRRT